jgi:hypothetical protein
VEEVAALGGAGSDSRKLETVEANETKSTMGESNHAELWVVWKLHEVVKKLWGCHWSWRDDRKALTGQNSHPCLYEHVR